MCARSAKRRAPAARRSHLLNVDRGRIEGVLRHGSCIHACDSASAASTIHTKAATQRLHRARPTARCRGPALLRHCAALLSRPTGPPRTGTGRSRFPEKHSTVSTPSLSRGHTAAQHARLPFAPHTRGHSSHTAHSRDDGSHGSTEFISWLDKSGSRSPSNRWPLDIDTSEGASRGVAPTRIGRGAGFCDLDAVSTQSRDTRAAA